MRAVEIDGDDSVMGLSITSLCKLTVVTCFAAVITPPPIGSA